MTKANLELLLRAYQKAVQQRSLDHIVTCSDKLAVVLSQIAPVKDSVDEEVKAIVIELQNTHVSAMAIVRQQRDELKAVLETSPQYKNRARAYATTQFAGQHFE